MNAILQTAAGNPENQDRGGRAPPEQAALDLIQLVRYPSGALPDDVTVILARGPGAGAVH
jgi:hypothetical protein